MILSNIDIHEMLDSGRLVIKPEPIPRDPSGPGCPYQTTAVDLTLGDELCWLKGGMPISVDLLGGKFNSLFSMNCERRVLKAGEPYVLQPNRFVLGKTHEHIELPVTELGPWLAARVEGRSSFARCGMLVHFTAPTIHAHFKGTITLEIMNFGPYPIVLHARMPICQLIVEEVRSRPSGRDSQFQGQADPTGGTRN